MDNRDRAAIDELFGKIADVERRSGPRDAEAEAYIRSLVARQPAAPYYMGQTIVVQEQALNEAQRRIDELEREAQGAGSGLLGGLFGSGGGRRGDRYAEAGRGAPMATGPWGQQQGGFLAGAMQTAVGVAGGVVLGSMIADWLTPDQAAASGPTEAEPGTFLGQENPAETPAPDAGDMGGDFDFGDFGL